MNTSETVTPQAATDEQLIHKAEQLHQERSAARLNRRRLITNLSMAAGAVGVAGMAGCTTGGVVPITSPTTVPTVLDVLTFALNLEYLEASFYSYIVTGSGLSAADMGSNPGAVTGGAKINFTVPAIANLAANLMTEEVQHVELLRATIQSAFNVTPVSMPALNLAALGAPTNDQTFIALARTIEGVGVSAYIGGAQYLTSSAAALNYAAQILDVEAQHSGALRQACIYFPGGAVSSPAADSLDMVPTATQIFNTSNTTGLNPVRTISQVLQIVYNTPGVTGTTKGAFFPNGLNGNIYIS